MASTSHRILNKQMSEWSLVCKGAPESLEHLKKTTTKTTTVISPLSLDEWLCWRCYLLPQLPLLFPFLLFQKLFPLPFGQSLVLCCSFSIAALLAGFIIFIIILLLGDSFTFHTIISHLWGAQMFGVSSLMLPCYLNVDVSLSAVLCTEITGSI